MIFRGRLWNRRILLDAILHNINYRTNDLNACELHTWLFMYNKKINKKMTNQVVSSIEAIKQLRLQEIENNSTYLLLKSLSPNITATKSYFFFQKNKGHHRRVFLYYLSKELGVANNLGFSKYVGEVLQW